jgi:prevent-host-death family protein
MKSASVSKLKATLSACLAWVKAGEEVVVTERGKPIAKIVPLSPDSSIRSSHLAALERAGLVKIGSEKLPKDFWEIPRPKDVQGVGLQALLKERETGR